MINTEILFNNILKSIASNTKIYFGCVRNLHHYRTLVPWTSSVEFSDFLKGSVIYNNNGLLVLNKPYGVTFSREGTRDGKPHEKHPDPEDLVFKKPEKNQFNKMERPFFTSGVTNDSLNLLDALPFLEKHFGFEKLHVSRVPGKFVSGVAVLTASEKLVQEVNKSHNRLPPGKDKYLVVVAGTPRCSSGKTKLGLKLEEDAKKGKRVILLHQWSNNAHKRGEVRFGTFHHQTICSGLDNLTSLVEIRSDLRKHNALRLFAADYLLSPVLGDNMFGSRVQSVMGVPMTVHHFSDVANSPQTLPPEVYSLLGLRASDAALIPIHVHLEEILLPRFLVGGQSLVLKAPPPAHFLWTCDRLGLVQSKRATVAVT